MSILKSIEVKQLCILILGFVCLSNVKGQQISSPTQEGISSFFSQKGWRRVNSAFIEFDNPDGLGVEARGIEPEIGIPNSLMELRGRNIIMGDLFELDLGMGANNPQALVTSRAQIFLNEPAVAHPTGASILNTIGRTAVNFPQRVAEAIGSIRDKDGSFLEDRVTRTGNIEQLRQDLPTNITNLITSVGDLTNSQNGNSLRIHISGQPITQQWQTSNTVFVPSTALKLTDAALALVGVGSFEFNEAVDAELILSGTGTLFTTAGKLVGGAKLGPIGAGLLAVDLVGSAKSFADGESAREFSEIEIAKAVFDEFEFDFKRLDAIPGIDLGLTSTQISIKPRKGQGRSRFDQTRIVGFIPAGQSVMPNNILPLKINNSNGDGIVHPSVMFDLKLSLGLELSNDILVAGPLAFDFSTDNGGGASASTGNDLANNDVTIANYHYVDWSNSDFVPLEGFSFAGVQISDADIGAVDFTNIQVEGLDFDNTLNHFNLIVSGTPTLGNGQLSSDGQLLKRILLQALAIPNSDHWVSLDIVNQGGQEVGRASATSSFKQTDICGLFFAADEKMKFDLYNQFTRNGQDPGLFEIWLQHFAGNNAELDMFLQLTNQKGFSLETTRLRGVIRPRIPEGTAGDAGAFIENADYRIDNFVDFVSFRYQGRIISANTQGITIGGVFVSWSATITGGSINIDGLTFSQAQWNYLFNNTNSFINDVRGRLSGAANRVSNSINNGTRSEYRKLNQILPVLIAAHWYKQVDLPVKQFSNAIDQCSGCNLSSFSSSNFGSNIAVSFDQARWDAAAFQLLTTETVDLSKFGIANTNGSNTLTFNIKGGVNNESPGSDNLYTRGLTNSQAQNLATLNESPIVPKTGRVPFLLEHPGAGLPELFFEGMSLNGFSSSSSRFEVGMPVSARFSIVNGGNVNTPSGGSGKFGGPIYYIRLHKLNNEGNIVKSWYSQKQGLSSPLLAKSTAQSSFEFILPSETGYFMLEAEITSLGETQRPDFNVANNTISTTFKIYNASSNGASLNSISASLNGEVINGTVRARSGTFTINNTTMNSGSDVQLNASKRIVLKGTALRNGSNVLLRTLNQGSSALALDLSGFSTLQTNNPISSKASPSNENIWAAEKVTEDVWASYKEEMFGPGPSDESTELAVQFQENEAFEESKVVLYPNPSRDFLHIRHGGTDVSATQIEIYDVNGRRIRSFSGSELNASGNQITINIQSLVEGLYIIKSTGGDLQFSTMFIKE